MTFGLYAADIEWEMTATLVVGSNTVYYGHDGVRAVGEHGVGRRSRVAVDRRRYALWPLREGLVDVPTYVVNG